MYVYSTVYFRARVESADKSVYFMADEDVVNGYLTKRICPQEGSVTLKQVDNRFVDFIMAAMFIVALALIPHFLIYKETNNTMPK